MKEWALGCKITQPVKLNSFSTVLDPQKFIKVQLEIMNNNNIKSRLFVAAYLRLYSLKIVI